MAAGLGFKTFTTGEVLTAADVNGYLMQGILVFATEAARNSAITSPQEGQFAFTKDNNSLWYYTGSAWVASGATGDIEGVTAGVGISGGGTSGTVTITNSMATAIDAKGDLVVGTGADTFSRLAVGTNNYVLTADSAEATGMKWAAAAGSSGPAFRATVSTAVSITSGAYVKLAFNTETFDTDSCYDPTTNYRFTPNKAGYYFVYIGAYLYANTSSSILLRLYKNGSVYLPAIWSNGGTANLNATATGSSFIYLNGSTDYIEAYGYHGGTSAGFGTENESAQFMAFWVRS